MAGFSNKARALRRMASIPPAVKAALKAQNAVNAAELVETAKRFAPPDETGALRESIRHADDSDDTRISQRVEAGGPTTTKPVRQSGKGSAPTYDYALAQEFGTTDAAANPFFWPAWRLKRRAFKRRMSKAAKAAIGQAVRK